MLAVSVHSLFFVTRWGLYAVTAVTGLSLSRVGWAAPKPRRPAESSLRQRTSDQPQVHGVLGALFRGDDCVSLYFRETVVLWSHEIKTAAWRLPNWSRKRSISITLLHNGRSSLCVPLLQDGL
jgi:hypothetical protein